MRFRLIAATNENLYKKTQDRKFRTDLLHRIGVAIINLPGLEAREKEEFNLLFQYFFQHHREKEGVKNLTLSWDKASSTLTKPSSDLVEVLWTNEKWPGNVRQLESTVRTMIIYADETRSPEDPLGPKDIPPEVWEKWEIFG